MSLFAEYESRRSVEVTAPVAELVIEPASQRDFDAIARLTVERQGGNLEDTRERIWRSLMQPADTHFVLVARIGDETVGFAKASRIDVTADPEYAQVPIGWYLVGLIVAPEQRRRGIGLALTRHRLRALAGRGVTEAFYFVNSLNRASIDLHRKLGFQEVQRDFRYPGATFSGGGTGILCRMSLMELDQLDTNPRSG
jgi:ribosomal protein S18 acetylase RimI-like enzyme